MRDFVGPLPIMQQQKQATNNYTKETICTFEYI